MAVELSKEEEKEDWYAVLGLEVDATESQINKAFKSLSLRWHPDKNGGSQEAHDMFMRVKEAKLFLMDGKKRKVYDEKRAARKKMENLMAERNRHMGQRRRQAREELERREKNFTSGASSGLGPGGEARVAAVKLEELRKQGDALRQQQSVAKNAAWDTARASSKKRRASWGASVSGADNDDEELEERTIKVKWSTKKQSHSDHTLDVLFSRFGKVESVSIEEGRGDRAFVTFAVVSSAAAAVEEYRDGETLRANFVGKRRTKRSGVFSPRRQTMSPTAHRRGAANDAEGGDISQSSFRDRESVVMMKLRQGAERQALIRKMAEQEGSYMATTPGKATQQSGDVAAKEASIETPVDHVNGYNGTPIVGKCVSPSTGPDDGGGISSGGADSIFPVPSPGIARTPNNFSLGRESDLLSAMTKSVAKGSKSSRPSMVSTGSTKNVPRVGTGSIDEGDILARMFATKG